ncbi:MAG: hypothetical protein GY788_29260 [bacterium]|nr:hypothetical protein [bacterium]
MANDVARSLASDHKRKFSKGFNWRGRVWFVKAVFAAESETGSQAGALDSLPSKLAKAKALVDARIAERRSNEGLYRFRERRRLRQKILYGALGVHPSLFEDGAKLDEVMWRRERIVDKMQFEVGRQINRGRQAATPSAWVDGLDCAFEYPHLKGEPGAEALGLTGSDEIQVNPSARAYWKSRTYWEDKNPRSDLILTTPADPIPAEVPLAHQTERGTTHPENAIASLFLRYPNALERNLLDCQHVSALLHYDSLLVPDDAPLIDALKETIAWNPECFTLCSVLEEPIGNKTAVSDSANGLFEVATVPEDDLQVGDHVFIQNHPAYNALVPEGAWQGEHSIVVDRWGPATDSRPRLSVRDRPRYQGHGTEASTLLDMTKGMLDEFDLWLKRARIRVAEEMARNVDIDALYFGGLQKHVGDPEAHPANLLRDTALESPGFPPHKSWYVNWRDAESQPRRLYLFEGDPPGADARPRDVRTKVYWGQVSLLGSRPDQQMAQVVRPRIEAP